MTTQERVILVDENDVDRGSEEKLRAHADGSLHRAFSVLVFNARGELLLQRRAADKYHSGGLWSNTCCGHPRPGEETATAARRRLGEEMGFDCDLQWLFGFRYRVELPGSMSEHEYDHVFVGRHNGDPVPNPGEFDAWRWAPLDTIRRDMMQAPERYTYWFRLLLERLPTSGSV